MSKPNIEGIMNQPGRIQTLQTQRFAGLSEGPSGMGYGRVTKGRSTDPATAIT
jgi:hypothetical protein